jgi:iron complex outermembrane receptor protein
LDLRLSPDWMPVFIALAFSIAVSGEAWAQASLGPEEIVVTARKKEESLQEVPLSISAFSAEQLQSAGVTNNYGVALLTVNFNTAAQLGRRLDRPVIRGMAAPAVGGEPNASYFIDGAFVSGSISAATLGPVERVEILRGPQSAQFGRATFSGAVNYVTRQATNEYEGEVRAVGGSNETVQITAWGSGPIVEDKLMFFASAGLDKFGGMWNNGLKDDQAQLGSLFVDPPQYGDTSPLGETETKEVTLKLTWTPTDTATITGKVGLVEARDGHYAQFILEPGELNCYLPTNGTPTTDGSAPDGSNETTKDNSNEIWYASSQGAYCGEFDLDKVSYAANNPFNPANPNPFASLQGAPANGESRQARFNLPDFREGMEIDPGFFYIDPPEQWMSDPREPGAERDQLRTLLKYDQDVGEWTVSTMIAYNEDEFDTAYDLDHTEKRPLAGVFHFYEQLEVDDRSAQLLLTSPVDTKWRGSIGLYYFEANKSSRTHSAPGFTTSPFGGLGQYSAPILTDIQNTAVFGSLEYDLTEKLMFSAEVRYANDNKTIETPYICDQPDPDKPFYEYNGEQVTDETDEDAFTPRLTLTYHANNDMMFYALAAKGNKPAEFNTAYFRPTANPCGSLAARDNPEDEGGSFTHTKEEEAWTYEVGGKTTWLAGRVLANLSLYYIDWTNQATFQTVQVGSVVGNVQRNAGRSEVYGLEFESSYGITDNFSASFSYGLANGTYLEYDDPFYANTTGIGLEDGKLVNGSNNVAGNSIPNNPKHSVVTALNYARNFTANVGWFARTDYIWESKRYVDAANFMTIPDRDIWNGRVGLESDRWTVTAWVDNILDDQTPTAIPNFLYFPDSGVSWANKNRNGTTGTNCASGNRCMVESWAASPQRGRNYGLDVIFRF